VTLLVDPIITTATYTIRPTCGCCGRTVHHHRRSTRLPQPPPKSQSRLHADDRDQVMAATRRPRRIPPPTVVNLNPRIRADAPVAAGGARNPAETTIAARLRLVDLEAVVLDEAADAHRAAAVVTRAAPTVVVVASRRRPRALAAVARTRSAAGPMTTNRKRLL
jgi:hypothetical protein